VERAYGLEFVVACHAQQNGSATSDSWVRRAPFTDTSTLKASTVTIRYFLQRHRSGFTQPGDSAD
jgi:hypothetical protein